MKFRTFPDVRQFPLYVGLITVISATVPALGLKGSLFYQMLSENRMGEEWGWCMMLSGLYLIVASLVDRRECLTVSLFLCALVWSAMTLMVMEIWFVDYTYMQVTQRWYTPTMMNMPVTAIMLWVVLFREMLLCPVQISERRKCVRG